MPIRKVRTEKAAYTPPDIANMFGLSHVKILDFIRTGELKAIDLSSKCGSRPRWYIREEDLESFLQCRTAKAPPAPKRRRRRVSAANTQKFY